MTTVTGLLIFVVGILLGGVGMAIASAGPAWDLERRLDNALETLRQIARGESLDPGRTAIEGLNLDRRFRDPKERRRALDL